MTDGTLRDRLAALSRREIAGLAVLAVVAMAGAGLWYVRSLPQPVEVRADPGPGAGAASPAAGVLIVHVAGWVRHPGVYELAPGDRVIDAVRAAGGPRRGAYLDALNLAAPLVDGQQVLVPKRPPTGGGALPGDTGGPPAPINLNTASAQELDALPGIGEVLAQRIVDYRTEHGPFTTVDQLVEVSGIGEATLEEIRDLVAV